MRDRQRESNRRTEKSNSYFQLYTISLDSITCHRYQMRYQRSKWDRNTWSICKESQKCWDWISIGLKMKNKTNLNVQFADGLRSVDRRSSDIKFVTWIHIILIRTTSFSISQRAYVVVSGWKTLTEHRFNGYIDHLSQLKCLWSDCNIKWPTLNWYASCLLSLCTPFNYDHDCQHFWERDSMAVLR